MANDDVTPGLYKQISAKLEDSMLGNKKIQRILSKAESGEATHRDLDAYSKELGKLTSKAFQGVLTEENLPNGELYYHIAQGTVGTTMKDNLARVNTLGAQVQESLNKSAGIGMKAVKVKDQTEWTNGLVNLMTQGDLADAVEAMGEPIVIACMHYASDFMKTNADYQYKSGLSPLISREASYGCCEWCAGLEGVYDYGTQPGDFYQRHDYCRCTITYDPRKGDGKVQDAWSKEWLSEEEAAKREERKTYGMARTYAKNDAGKYRKVN